MRFAVRWLVLSFALVLILPASAVAAPAGWLSTHYYEFSELSLGTQAASFSHYDDCKWPGAEYVVSTSPDFTPFNCGQPNFVWAATCKPGVQTVAFKRRIWLPGEPSTLKASLVSLGDRPMAFMGISVNGSSILRTRRSVHHEGLKSQTDAFKHGWNVIEVTSKKPVTGACNEGSADTGVYGHVYAKFEADLSITRPKLSFRGNGAVQGTMTVRNHGPTVMTAGEVHFTAYTLQLQVIRSPDFAIVLQGGGLELDECEYSYESTTYEEQDYSGYRTYCPLKPLLPGETATITITYKVKIPETGEFFYKWPIRWVTSSREVNDPRLGNNEGIRLQGACRPARPPLCTKTS